MAAYYNEIDPFAASWLRELIKAGCIAPGEVDERSIADVQPADLAGFTQCHFFAGISGWELALRQAGWPDEKPVWTGSCPCFPADTLIHTKDGLVPIQDIRPGMEVLTHKKRWRTVVRTGSKPFQETIVLRGQGHYGLSCTPNHPFLTSEGSWVEANSMQHKRWVNASELLCGDGFWRPTKPYALPLAPGLPGRMGRMRGYGNALCVPQAQAFIEAFIDYQNTLTGEGEGHDQKRID